MSRFSLPGLLVLQLTGALLPAQVPLFVRLDQQQNPPGLNWFRIETPHFRVVFPDSLRREAQRAASLLEATYGPLTKTLRREPERLSVILNNQSAIANAFVALAPRRSEWYVLPPAGVEEMGPIDWFSLLAVHEGRHVVQERAVRDGFVGLLGRVFGQSTTAFVGGGLYFPSWYWEGDAVGMETALTNAGRGRQPQFANRIRTTVLTGRAYPYYQAWHRSYRDYYPDWYQLGYLLTTHVKRKYGEDAWRKAVHSAAWWPLPPWALSHGLKKATGRSLTQLHREAIAELDTLWRAQVDGLVETPAHGLTGDSAGYHVWRMPQVASDGSIIAEYADLSRVSSLVRLKDGRRETLVRGFGTRGEQTFHVSGNQVVWAEYEMDPRFTQRSYVVLRLMDLTTRRVQRLTKGDRHLSPALSPDGRQVAAVRFGPDGSARVELRSAEDGRLLRVLPNEGSHYLVTPAWSPDGASVYVVAVDRSRGRGNALVRVDLARGTTDTVLAFRQDAIVRPVATGHWVLYGSPASGIDNIEALDLTNGRTWQVTSRRHGATNPAVAADGQRLVFQDYGPDGHDVAEMALDPGTWTPTENVKPRRVDYFEPLVAQEQGRSIVADVPWQEWSVEPYRGVSRGLAVHSLTFSPNSDESNGGLALHARNLLNTLGASAGVLYNLAEHTAAVEAGVSYGGWYPLLDAAVRAGSMAGTATTTTGQPVRYHWNETSYTLGARVPLVRLRGLATQSLSAGATVGVTDVSNKPVRVRFDNNNGRFVPLSYSLVATHFGPNATRDILPRGALGVVSYRHTPFAGDYSGHLLSIRGAVYLRGVHRNHGIALDAVREEQRPGNYAFSSEYAASRGYDKFTHERYTRVGASYALPLLYPDVAIGPLAYVKRVQGAVFGDYGRGTRRDGSRPFLYRSYGVDLTTDVHPLQLRGTMRVGARVSYRVDEAEHWRAQYLLSLPF